MMDSSTMAPNDYVMNDDLYIYVTTPHLDVLGKGLYRYTRDKCS